MPSDLDGFGNISICSCFIKINYFIHILFSFGLFSDFSFLLRITSLNGIGITAIKITVPSQCQKSLNMYCKISNTLFTSSLLIYHRANCHTSIFHIRYKVIRINLFHHFTHIVDMPCYKLF